ATSGLRLAVISASSAIGASRPAGSARGAAAAAAPAAVRGAPRPAAGLITVRSDSKAAKGSFSRPVSLMLVSHLPPRCAAVMRSAAARPELELAPGKLAGDVHRQAARGLELLPQLVAARLEFKVVEARVVRYRYRGH